MSGIIPDPVRASIDLFNRVMAPFLGPFGPPAPEAPPPPSTNTHQARGVSQPTPIQQRTRDAFGRRQGSAMGSSVPAAGLHTHLTGMPRFDDQFKVMSNTNNKTVVLQTALPINQMKTFLCMDEGEVDEIIDAFQRARARTWPKRKPVDGA